MSEVTAPVHTTCSRCGGLVDTDARFCKHCAHDLSSPAPATNLPPQKLSNWTASRILLVSGLAVVGVVVLALLGTYLYKRSRTQPSAAISSPSPATPTISDRARQVEEKILRNEQLADSDIAGLSAYDLRVLRNLHFARYGRKYDQNGELGGYFYSRPWYKPSESYNDNMLTALDKTNINLIVAMERANNVSGQQATPTENVEQTNVDPALQLEREAIAEVRRVFESQAFTKCGDSYYSNDSLLTASGIAQRKNPSYEVLRISPITEADSLNNVTWKGRILMRFQAKRLYRNGAWSDWQPYESLLIYTLDAQKRGSAWNVGSTYLMNRSFRKINCSDVPR